MSHTRKFLRKNKDGSTKTYYADVDFPWVYGRVVQRYIRPVGTDSEKPSTIQMEPLHLGFIATKLMQGDLTPDELLDMLEGMGRKVLREELEAVGIRYSFKRTVLLSPFAKSGSEEGGKM
jgi:hypothetical protein